MASSKIDIPLIAQKLLPNAEHYVREWLPDGRLKHSPSKGKTWVVKNWLRGEKTAGSFVIWLENGCWKDHADNSVHGGDLVSLYAYFFTNNDQYKAAIYLNERYNLTDTYQNNKKAKKAKNGNTTQDENWTVVKVIPEGVKLPEFPKGLTLKNSKGEEKFCEWRAGLDDIFTFKDIDGNRLHYGRRFNKSDFLDKKEPRPLTLWQHKNGSYQWRYAGYPAPRPLYGLPLLKQAEKTVLLVEGENKVNKLIGWFKENYSDKKEDWPYIPLSWQGGVNGYTTCDLTVLEGKNIIYWPDNDSHEASLKSMFAIKKQYGGHVLSIPKDKKPKHKDSGWDCADAIEEGINIVDFIKERLAVGEPDEPKVVKKEKPQKLINEDDTRPIIQIDALKYNQYMAQTREILSGTRDLFQRGSDIVRVARYDQMKNNEAGKPNGNLQITAIEPLTLVDNIMKHACPVKYDKRSEEWKPCKFPTDDARVITKSPETSGLATLKGIVSAPLFKKDGTMLHKQGYDEDTALYLDTGGVDFAVHKILNKPTQQDALNALNELNEVIKDFPFLVDKDGQSPDKSVMLAAMISVPVRQFLPAMPLVIFSAPTAGSGKSKLAKIIGALAEGEDIAPITYTRDEEEFKKVAGIQLMTGSRVNLMDNVNGVIDSQWLQAALTSPTVQCRILGKSEGPKLPSNAIWLATGNNIELRGDLTRRAIYCRIDPKTDRPWEKKFDFEPVSETIKNRTKYYRAALTILKAYHVAGRPSQGLNEYGSFEEWSDLVRNALVWLGCADPLKNQKALEDNDTKKLAQRALLAEWWQLVNGGQLANPITSGEIYDQAIIKNELGEFKNALIEACGGRAGIITNSQPIGNYLAKAKGTHTCTLADETQIELTVSAAKGRANKIYFKIEQEGKKKLNQQPDLLTDDEVAPPPPKLATNLIDQPETERVNGFEQAKLADPPERPPKPPEPPPKYDDTPIW